MSRAEGLSVAYIFLWFCGPNTQNFLQSFKLSFTVTQLEQYTTADCHIFLGIAFYFSNTCCS